MTAVLNSKGVNLTLLDANVVALTEGEGATARLKVVEDQISLPVTFFSATANYARLCRFPTTAKIKRLTWFTDAAVDAAATTGATTLSIGVAFSDDTADGTPPWLQGLVPSTVGVVANGGSTTAGTTVALPSTSAANDFFGAFTPSATTAPIPLTDATFGGLATYGSPLYITQTPLVNIFNFLDGQGNLQRNLGYFDIYFRSTHAYTTVPTTAANLYVRLEYV
jgi:hypothetical protein